MLKQAVYFINKVLVENAENQTIIEACEIISRDINDAINSRKDSVELPEEYYKLTPDFELYRARNAMSIMARINNSKVKYYEILEEVINNKIQAFLISDLQKTLMMIESKLSECSDNDSLALAYLILKEEAGFALEASSQTDCEITLKSVLDLSREFLQLLYDIKSLELPDFIINTRLQKILTESKKGNGRK